MIASSAQSLSLTRSYFGNRVYMRWSSRDLFSLARDARRYEDLRMAAKVAAPTIMRLHTAYPNDNSRDIACHPSSGRCGYT